MTKRLLILLIPLALAGCVTEQAPTLPMTLGPSDSAKAACLTYGDAPTFGDCKGADVTNTSQNTK
jgi:hypothetical protein